MILLRASADNLADAAFSVSTRLSAAKFVDGGYGISYASRPNFRRRAPQAKRGRNSRKLLPLPELRHHVGVLGAPRRGKLFPT
jgi:hypothetical protein